MDLSGRSVALYGRFTPGERERLAARVVAAGGETMRDFTRGSDELVVGGLASALVDSGALPKRLAAARQRGAPVFGERAFATRIVDDPPPPPPKPTLPVAGPLAQAGLVGADAELLAVFDLISLADDCCAFADAGVIRTAGELIAAGRRRGEVVRILTRARDLAPAGRRRIVLTAGGEAALQWDDGVTTLEGQGLMTFDGAQANLDDLLEAAAAAEGEGNLPEAARLYDLAARADRKDATAAFNYANIRLAEGAFDEAALGYQRALAREPSFVEARYNFAQALEAAGKLGAAAVELGRVLAADPAHADALFNLAQLRLNAGEFADAKVLFERYLALGPPPEWASTARKAILYCAAQGVV